MDPQSSGLLVLTGLMLSCAALGAALWGVAGARRLGPVVCQARPGRARKQLATGALLLLAAVIALADTGVPRAPALQVLVLAAALLLLNPGLRDTALATTGVRAGWFVRRFEELEEWRLTGDHLRWKLLGEWQACEVPPGQRADLRARLERLIPDRESRFKA